MYICNCKCGTRLAHLLYIDGWKLGFKRGLKQSWNETGQRNGLKALRVSVLSRVRDELEDVSEDELTALKKADLDLLVEVVAATDEAGTTAEIRAALDHVCSELAK